MVGFPQGGDNLSITSGVVSRIGMTQYVHGAAPLLAIQIDAAINPGNSGGPSLHNGEVVGLAFQVQPYLQYSASLFAEIPPPLNPISEPPRG